MAESRVTSRFTQSIDARWWRWRTVVANKWKNTGEHINALEMRGVLLSYLWRVRRRERMGRRFVHLVDSMVTMGGLTKGRSSSGQLRSTLMRVNAIVLGGFLYPIVGHTRSHLNPADAPSRQKYLKHPRSGRIPVQKRLGTRVPRTGPAR